MKFNVFQKKEQNRTYYTWQTNKDETINWISNVTFNALKKNLLKSFLNSGLIVEISRPHLRIPPQPGFVQTRRINNTRP
jgi:hypothetical protein